MFIRSYHEPDESIPSDAVIIWSTSIFCLQQAIDDAVRTFCLVIWAEMTYFLPDWYSVTVFVVTTITTPVLPLFSMTGYRHAVPLYDGTVYRDQSSVAYRRQWHLHVGIWTWVKLALTLLVLEHKCSGTWPQKPANGCIVVHIRTACFLKIFLNIINQPLWKLG